MPDTRERFAALNLEPIGSSPEEFAQFLKQDLQKYAEIARKPKIEPQQSFDEFPAARRLEFGPG